MCRPESRGCSEAKILKAASGGQRHEGGPGFRIDDGFVTASGVAEPVNFAFEFQKIMHSLA